MQQIMECCEYDDQVESDDLLARKRDIHNIYMYVYV